SRGDRPATRRVPPRLQRPPAPPLPRSGAAGPLRGARPRPGRAIAHGCDPGRLARPRAPGGGTLSMGAGRDGAVDQPPPRRARGYREGEAAGEIPDLLSLKEPSVPPCSARGRIQARRG